MSHHKNGGGGLKGVSPTPFTGDRTKSAQFKCEMLRFIKLNSEHELIKEYYSRILYCLTLFRGPAVTMWVNAAEDEMEAIVGDINNPITVVTHYLVSDTKTWSDDGDLDNETW